jgi:hypothetical protein
VTPAGLLKSAAVVALLQYSGHTALFLSAKPRHGALEQAVVEAMRTHRFDFLGSMRSYWDFYFGYGLMAVLSGFIQAALLWQLARMAEAGSGPLRPMIALFFVANVGHAIVAGTYFFVVPVIPDLVIAVLLGAAFFMAAA